MGQATTRGIFLGVLAYGLFCVHDAEVKWLVATTPVWQVLFFRSVIVLAGTVAIGRGKLLRRAVDSPLKWQLAGRAVLMLTAWICYYTASRSLPLAQLLTLYFAAPLIITLLAARMLNEHVTAARWGAVVIGFVGVLFASDPFGVTASFPTLLVLIASVLWAYGIVLMRRIARQESSLLQMLFSNALFMVATGAASVVTWHTPTGFELLLALGVGLFGGLAQYSVFEAARMVPASVLATVEYSALLWAFLLGYAIWGDIPVLGVFVGAGLIVAAGVLLVVTERRKRDQSPRVAPTGSSTEVTNPGGDAAT